MRRQKKALELHVKKIAHQNWAIFKEGRKSPLEDELETQDLAEYVARRIATDSTLDDNRPAIVYTHSSTTGNVRRQKSFSV